MSWFDVVISFIVILSLIVGFISGFVKQLASLVGIVAGVLFSGQLALKINPVLHRFLTETPDRIIQVISYIVAFLAIFIIFTLVGLIIRKMLKLLQLNIIDHMAGSVFCALKWLLVASVFLNVILVLDVKQRIIKPDVRENSLSYPYIKSITSYFIPFLDFDKPEED